MDKFALLKFSNDSLSVVSVNIIDGYDPVGNRTSKTLPQFKDPTEKDNWVKVLWPPKEKKSRALRSLKKTAAQVVSPVRSDPEDLPNTMLAEDDIDGCNSSTAKKAVKRKGDLLEERILRRLGQELDQRGPSVSGTAVEEAVECDSLEPEEADEKVNAAEAKAAAAEAKAAAAEAKAAAAEAKAAEAEAKAAEAEAKAAEAEAKAAEAEAKAAEAEAKAAAAEAKAVAAEEKAAECISRMRALQEHIQALEAQQFQERLDEAEARVEAAEAKALYAVDTLYPLLQALPSIVDALKSSVAAGAPAACSAEPLRRPCKFGSVVIPATRMVRLENCQPSVYTQELAAMVFGTDVLAKSCLKGSSIGGGKEPLQKDAVDDIIAHVMSKFPVLSESTVRTFLRRKCNNAATALKKVAVNDEQREQNRQQENTN